MPKIENTTASSNSRLKRRPVPILKSHGHRKGSELIVARNFSHGGEFIRRNQNYQILLNVRFSSEGLGAQVVLSSNIHGAWSEYDFERSGELEYSLKLRCANPGSYQFKVKYSLNTGKTWHWDNVPHSSLMIDPIDSKSLRIYSLIPTQSGPISRWSLELNRIKEMGFNAVHILPLTHLDKSESPYAAFDFFDLDPSYATPGDDRPLLEQFESFVEEAKSLGIKLCIDIVLNHVGTTSQISTLCPDWIVNDAQEKDGLKRAGCWHGDKWLTWHDLVLIEYDHPNLHRRKEIWDYMLAYLLFWSNYANHTDGVIRLDNLHSTPRGFLEFAVENLRLEFPQLTILAELFTDPQTAHRKVYFNGLNLLLATPWVNPYAQQFRQDVIKMHRDRKIRYFFPVNSHDSGSPTQEYGAPETIVPRYAACALMGTGQTGMTQGAEFGAKEKLRFIGRQKSQETLEMSSSTWGYDFSDAIKQINQLAFVDEVFAEVGNLEFVEEDHGALLGAIRTSADRSKGFLIITSFDTKSQHQLRIKFNETLPRGSQVQLRYHYNPQKNNILVSNFIELTENMLIEPCEVKIFEFTPKQPQSL